MRYEGQYKLHSTTHSTTYTHLTNSYIEGVLVTPV